MKITPWLILAVLFLSCSHPTRFRLLTPEETGITFENKIVENDSMNAASFQYIYNGAGVGIADLNNDGLQDIILVGNQVSTRVYLNLGNFKFRDITEQFKGLTNNQWYSGVAIADVNGDGWPDVYLTSGGSNNPAKCRNRLWINKGCVKGKDPEFVEMAEKYGIADEHQSAAAGFFDYNRDGYLDLYVLNNNLTEKSTSTASLYRPKINDGTAENNDQLYRNNGDGTFTNVTIPAGITCEGFGLGMAIGDINKDGYPDIYISNDFVSNDILYINQGNGTFRNEIKKYISYQSRSSMGNDMADINNDGYPDIYTLDMMPEKYYKRKQTNNGFSYLYYIYDAKYDYEHQYVRNMLHLSNGLLRGNLIPYSEVGQMMGIFQTEWSWSPLFADFNNDGRKDLMITNGFPRDMTFKDVARIMERIKGSVARPMDYFNMAPVVKVPNVAFENKDDLHFIDRTHEWLGDIPSISNGAAFVDLDNDGDLDYVVNNFNDKPFIFRNYTVERSGNSAHFIRIKLQGNYPNTMAIGAKVEIWSGGNYQFTEHYLTRGYASSVDPVVHFGLGKNTMIDSVRVEWPASGNFTSVRNVKANQLLVIDEKESKPKANFNPSSENRLLFESCDSITEYVHEQADFVDFFLKQKVIPHKFSQIGPVMAKGDIDGDGREDLIIGSTNKLPTTVMLRKGNKFEKTDFKGLTTKKEFQESDIAVVDINKDGMNDVIATAGGYENPDTKDYRHYLYLNRGGYFERTELPIPPFPASVIRICDFNHDGYPDIFIGARVKKDMYPYSDSSWIILNDKGKLKVESWSGFDLGMVTDAVWSDYDNDGWEDLIITREWNSIVILRNNQGKSFTPVVLPGFESHKGIWYSIAAGDFDNNGYQDYIVGNLGENNRFEVSDKYPMNLYAIDIDNDGIIDPIMTGFWEDKNGVMKEYPVNYLDELAGQSSYFKRKFKSYTEFSYATIDDIIPPGMKKKINLKLSINTLSSYVIWNDGGKFRWEKLPESLQVSPITRMIVRDLNGDTYPDIIAGGNDYTYDVSTGNYDACKGMVMLSRGKLRSFDVLPPSKSGLLLQGMIGSLLWFDGDPPLLVAGFNRDRTVVYKQTPASQK